MEGKVMERTRPHASEKVAAKLRRVGALVGQGMLVTEAVRHIGVSNSTYYRWRAARRVLPPAGSCAPDSNRERRLRQLEVENTRLRRAVAELTIEKQALKEAVSGLA